MDLTRNPDHASPVVAEIVDVDRSPRNGSACPHCGAPLDGSDSFCTSCGQPRHGESESRNLPPDTQNRKWFECKNCGSTVATDPDHRSYTCPFCDSNYVIERDPLSSGRRAPDYIIGFDITTDQAHEKFRAWIGRNSWYRPGDLNRSRLETKLVGVYLPFWSFSMLAQSRWSAQIGEYWYRTETYTTRDSKGNLVTRTRTVQETEWWPLSGRHHRYYHGYLVSGSRGLTQAQADRIKPFQLPALHHYEPYFLAGWLCEEYSVEHDEALEICQAVFEGREQQNIGTFMPGDTCRGLETSTGFSHINADLCLLPVYLWSYRYRDQVFRFMVNGQTGKVYGDKPWSRKRVAALVVFLLVLALAVVLTLYLTGVIR